jgi:hypothetical protein
MAITFGPWQKLNPATIESTPDLPGIFEIANLVRSILYCGRADGSLQQRLAGLGPVPRDVPASIGGYYVRVALAVDEEAALAERHAAFREAHAGRLPVGNDGSLKPAIRLVTRNAA